MASWIVERYDYDTPGRRHGVLYCSPKCADQDGKRYGGRYITDEEYDQSEHGALCPVCEQEYEEF